MNALPSDFPLLKGADCIVAESAKLLGLPIYVKPCLINAKEDKYFKYAFTQNMYEDFGVGKRYRCYAAKPSMVFDDEFCICKARDITWCQELRFHRPDEATLHDREEASAGSWHRFAAILIKIPKWSEFRQRLIAISTGECYDVTGAEDGMVKDFRIL